MKINSSLRCMQAAHLFMLLSRRALQCPLISIFLKKNDTKRGEHYYLLVLCAIPSYFHFNMTIF